MAQVLQVEYKGTLAPYHAEERILAESGARLTVVRCADADELVRTAADADVIWLEWAPALDRSALERLPRTGLVVRWGVGYDQVDVAAASELGIVVANAPAYCTQDVAEHTVALILGLRRQVVAADRWMHEGGWGPLPAHPLRLQGATVGVVGLGRIGRRIARLLDAFGARVIGYDVSDGAVDGVERVGLDQLWAESDLVTLHVPDTPATHHMVNAVTLARTKPGLGLVNVSRGGLVDTDAVLTALQSGSLAGVALDVYEEEPLAADHPLRHEPRAILTPHIGASSEHSIADLRSEVCGATIEWLTTGWTSSAVNPWIKGHHRRSPADD